MQLPTTVKCKASMHIGKKYSIQHNLRTYDKDKWNTDGHIDANRSKLNVVLCNSDLKEWFHTIFDKAIDEFNAKNRVKHSERLIDKDKYFREQSSKVQECIIQLGDHLSYYEMVQEYGQAKADELHVQFLTQAYNEWLEQNPSLKVFSAVIHMDEIKDGTPHMHLDFLPVAESTRGLTVKVSVDGALKQLGFKRTKGQAYADAPYRAWLSAQRDRIEAAAAKYVDLIPSEHTGKKHIETYEYKAQQAMTEMHAKQKECEIAEDKLEKMEKLQQEYEKIVEDRHELAKKDLPELQSAKKMPLGFTAIKTSDLEILVSKAQEHRDHITYYNSQEKRQEQDGIVKRLHELQSEVYSPDYDEKHKYRLEYDLRQRTAAVLQKEHETSKKEQELTEKEKRLEAKLRAVNHIQDEYERKYAAQVVLNDAYETLSDQYKEADRQAFTYRRESEKKQKIIDGMEIGSEIYAEWSRRQRENIVKLKQMEINELTSKIQQLEEQNQCAWQIVENTCKAIGMFQYTDDPEYSAPLAPPQKDLLDATRDYIIEETRKIGKVDLANNLRKFVGICKAVGDKIKNLVQERKEREENRMSRGGYGRSL